MTQLNTQDQTQTGFTVSAKLHSVEEDLAYFTYKANEQDEENILTWPASKLPEDIDLGDDAQFILDFNLTEETKEKREKKAKNEEKYKKMRALLQDLVN